MNYLKSMKSNPLSWALLLVVVIVIWNLSGLL